MTKLIFFCRHPDQRTAIIRADSTRTTHPDYAMDDWDILHIHE
jgi:hypothetical protein